MTYTQAQIQDNNDKVWQAARRVGLEIKTKVMCINTTSRDTMRIFANLRPLSRSSVYSVQNKLHLYKRIVKLVLLYGSECWQVVETDLNKIDEFLNECLRRTLRIFWPRTISNFESPAKIDSERIQTKIKQNKSGLKEIVIIENEILFK